MKIEEKYKDFITDEETDNLNNILNKITLGDNGDYMEGLINFYKFKFKLAIY